MSTVIARILSQTAGVSNHGWNISRKYDIFGIPWLSPAATHFMSSLPFYIAESTMLNQEMWSGCICLHRSWKVGNDPSWVCRRSQGTGPLCSPTLQKIAWNSPGLMVQVQRTSVVASTSNQWVGTTCNRWVSSISDVMKPFFGINKLQTRRIQ